MKKIKKLDGEIYVNLHVVVLEPTHKILSNAARIKSLSVGKLIDIIVSRKETFRGDLKW